MKRGQSVSSDGENETTRGGIHLDTNRGQTENITYQTPMTKNHVSGRTVMPQHPVMTSVDIKRNE